MIAKRFLVLMTTCLLIVETGCYHFRLTARDEPATDYQKRTMHALLWGLVQDREFTDNCLDGAIHDVRVSTNVGYLLVSGLTLGIWIPLDMEWRCAKGTPPDSTVFSRN